MGLTLVMIMTLLGMALFEMSTIEGALARSDVSDMQAFYCAEAEVARVRQLYLPANNPEASLGDKKFEGKLDLANGRYDVTSKAVVENGKVIRITATCRQQNGRTRTVQREETREFTATQFGDVAGGFNPITGSQEFLGDFVLGGYGTPQSVGGALVGGADVVNGDIFVSGNVYVRGEATVTGYGSDSPPAITVPVGKSVVSTSPRFDPMAPGNTGTAAAAPLPVLSNAAGTGAIDEIKAAVTNSDGTPRMTGTYKGTTVYNLSEIFNQLGATNEGNSERNLARPTGCTFGVASSEPDCQIWQDLVIVGPRRTSSASGESYYFMGLPRSPSSAPQGTSFGTVYAAAVAASAELRQLGFTPAYSSLGSRLDALLGSNPTGSGRVSRLVDFTMGTDPATGKSLVRSQPPIFYADGEWRGEGAPDLAYNGRATIVSGKSMVISDNLLYLGGLANVNTSIPPATACPDGSDGASCGLADMLALVAKDDIWIGDANGTVKTVSAVLLAGRDVNLSEPLTTGLKGPSNPITFNGAVMAARQTALARDWADPSAGHESASCNVPQAPCRPVVFVPTDSSCGVPGCWRFLTFDQTQGLSIDAGTPSFRDGCVTTTTFPLSPATCPVSTRRVTHFQLVINYDGRLLANPELTPPGLPTGGTKYTGLASKWRDCGSSYSDGPGIVECPPEPGAKP